MRKFSIFTGVALFALAAIPAMADIQYSLTSDHCTSGCSGGGNPPFGTVTLHDNGGGSVHVTVSLLNGNKFVNTGFDASFMFNLVNNPVITVSNVSSNWSLDDLDGGNANSTAAATGSNISFDGLGNFDYGMVCTGCGNGGGGGINGPLTFDVAASGLTLASFAENSRNNQGTIDPNGFVFGADILSGTTGQTGPVGASGPGTQCTDCQQGNVPEPTSIALLGGILVFTARRIRRHV